MQWRGYEKRRGFDHYRIESSELRESSSEANGSESQVGDMGGEGNGSLDWAGLMSVRVGKLGG